MKIKVYNITREKMFQIVREADENSFTKTGSHDDSRREVSVNGIIRPVHKDTYQWVGADSSYKESSNDPGSLEEEIKWATVLDVYANYGTSHRARSHLLVFIPSKRDDEVVVLDLMEVGEQTSIPVFKTHSVLEALCAAKRGIKLELELEHLPAVGIEYIFPMALRALVALVDGIRAAIKATTEVEGTEDYIEGWSPLECTLVGAVRGAKPFRPQVLPAKWFDLRTPNTATCISPTT